MYCRVPVGTCPSAAHAERMRIGRSLFFCARVQPRGGLVPRGDLTLPAARGLRAGRRTAERKEGRGERGKRKDKKKRQQRASARTPGGAAVG